MKLLPWAATAALLPLTSRSTSSHGQRCYPSIKLTAEKSMRGFLDSPHWCIELFYASIATVRCLIPMTTSTTKATSSTATKESEILLDVIQRFASRHPA